MNFLTQAVGRTAGYKKLLGCVKRGTLPVEASGLADIHKALTVAALLYDTNRKGIFILPDEGQATTMCEDLSALGIKSLLLPSRDLLLSNITASSKEYERLRADTLSALSDGAFDVVCLSAESATNTKTRYDASTLSAAVLCRILRSILSVCGFMDSFLFRFI